MDPMTTRSLVTNEQVAQDLGISHSMVSRIRSGDRTPSLEMMDKIKKVIGWDFVDQVHASLNNEYADRFERAIARHYG